jgi:hypothetical protein
MFSFNSTLFNTTSLYSLTANPKSNSQEQFDQDRFANQRLNQSLKENAGVELPPEKSVKESESVFDVEAVIDTVMNQISKRIDQARDNGASDEDLKGMFEAAKSGVEKGFSQAREQINAVNKLNEPLGEKITAAEDGIYKGIDNLSDKTFNPESVQITPRKLDSVEYFKSYERTQNNFEFEVTTQEGDVVKVTAMSDKESFQQALLAQVDGNELYANYSEENNASGFNLQVEGDLNEAEMKALESLMSQVNDLAEEFYTGDLDTAFNMAMDLTSDADQIAEFSLDLKQSFSSSKEYGSASGDAMTNYAKPSLPKGLADPLADFAEGVKDAYEQASSFQNPRSLLDNLFQQMDTQAKMPSLLQPMLDALESQ